MKWSGRPKFNMKPEDAVRIRHMIDSIQSAIRFTQGRKRQELEQDEMLAFALLTTPCRN